MEHAVTLLALLVALAALIVAYRATRPRAEISSYWQNEAELLDIRAGELGRIDPQSYQAGYAAGGAHQIRQVLADL